MYILHTFKEKGWSTYTAEVASRPRKVIIRLEEHGTRMSFHFPTVSSGIHALNSLRHTLLASIEKDRLR